MPWLSSSRPCQDLQMSWDVFFGMRLELQTTLQLSRRTKVLLHLCSNPLFKNKSKQLLPFMLGIGGQCCERRPCQWCSIHQIHEGEKLGLIWFCMTILCCCKKSHSFSIRGTDFLTTYVFFQIVHAGWGCSYNANDFSDQFTFWKMGIWRYHDLHLLCN